MTTDLRTLFKEESNKLSIKEKEFKSLILDFENQFRILDSISVYY